MEKRVRFKSIWLPWLLVAPQMAIVLVFFFWPAAQGIYQSFLQEDPFGLHSEFVGWENFRQLFADPSYLDSALITVVFSVLVAFLTLAIALLLAAMANRVVRGAMVYRTLIIWPYAVAPIVAGVLWLMMFTSPWGVVSHLLQALGYNWNQLLRPGDAMALVVMASVWNQIPYDFLFFLAGLQSVPRAVIEAATIDGASRWRRFWTITFPLLSPITFFLLVMNVAYAFFETFAVIDAATQGGPGQSTTILVYRVYYQGFKALDVNGSATQSLMLMVVVILLTVIQFHYVEKKVQYA